MAGKIDFRLIYSKRQNKLITEDWFSVWNLAGTYNVMKPDAHKYLVCIQVIAYALGMIVPNIQPLNETTLNMFEWTCIYKFSTQRKKIWHEFA